MRKFILGLLSLIIFFNPLFSEEQNIVQEKGAVMLPAQYVGYFSFPLSNENPSSLPRWSDFQEKYGNWTILFDKQTGQPHRAFGKPIKINGFDKIDSSNILHAAKAFLDMNTKYFRIPYDNLILKKYLYINGLWYVSFSQQYQGLEVLLSEVELRITSDGKVCAFGFEYFESISIDTEMRVTIGDIEESALNGLQFNPKTDIIQNFDLKKYILPVRTDHGIFHKLVVKNEIITQEPHGRFTSFVDAHHGWLIWRINHLRPVETSFNIKGGIRKRFPTDTESIVNFPREYIGVDTNYYITDDFGNVSSDLSYPANFYTKLSGPFVKVKRDTSSNNAFFESVAAPGSINNILWDDTNSNIIERTLFYHTNYIHDYYKKLDTSLTCMDFQMEIKLYFCSSPAYSSSSGDKLIFICADNPEIKLAESPSVLYHEWTHSLNYYLYRELGSSTGMINDACNEALSDISSAFILDDPEIGRNTYLGESYKPYIRTCENKMIYPDSLAFESHNDGRILSGALWDLRRFLGLKLVEKLVHFAKYSRPDDLNIGKAFTEWFIDILIADDDDGDLTNGTPHFETILFAFNNHNIGTGLFIANSFSHNPLSDTKDTTSPYNVEFDLRGMSMPNCKPDSVMLIYSVDGFKSYSAIPAVEFYTGRYKADIPVQKPGTMVQYYIYAVDPRSKKSYRFGSGSGFSLKYFSFLVGYESRYIDNFQNDTTSTKWLSVDESDNATQGKWEWANPNKIDFSIWGLGYLQPGDGRSGTDDNCFVTGSKGDGYTYKKYMPNGKTTLTSPVFNLSDYTNPVIRFYYWFYVYPKFYGDDYLSKFKIQVSSNAGINWFDYYTTSEKSQGWELFQFPLSNFTEKMESFRIRFIADAPESPEGNPFCYSEYLLDDVEFLHSLGTIQNVNPSYFLSSGIQMNIDCFPIPSDNSVNINMFIHLLTDLKISVVNIFGNEISQVFNGALDPGAHSFIWNGLTSAGFRASPGIYFIVITTNSGKVVKKIVMN